jgi:hypothetical protein
MKPVRFLSAVLAMAPVLCLAQTGRGFVSIEGYVGLAREVQVGKIVGIEQTEVSGALQFPQNVGKPYRVTFAVSETIRGDKVKQVDMVLALQVTQYLDYLRAHQVEIMLVAGPNRLDSFPSAEVGIAEQGRRVDGDWYQFRVLEPVSPAGSAKKSQVGAQIDTYYDSGRMFACDLSVIHGRSEILKGARAFARRHREMLRSVWLRVPNAFGARCGDPNAFCGITLPICPETQRTLLALVKNPDLIELHMVTALSPAERRYPSAEEISRLAAELLKQWPM